MRRTPQARSFVRRAEVKGTFIAVCELCLYESRPQPSEARAKALLAQHRTSGQHRNGGVKRPRQ